MLCLDKMDIKQTITIISKHLDINNVCFLMNALILSYTCFAVYFFHKVRGHIFVLIIIAQTINDLKIIMNFKILKSENQHMLWLNNFAYTIIIIIILWDKFALV